MSMTLEKYFSENDDTPAALSERTGVHVKTIEKLRRTGSIPNGTVMLKIYLATGGAVTPFDFWKIKPLRSIYSKAA